MFKKNYLLSIIIVLSVFLISACASPSETEINNQNLGQGSIDETSSSQLGESRPDAKTTLYFFWGDGCPHCEVEREFLEEMQDKYSDLEIKMYETWKDRDNAQILQEMAEAYGARASGVPMTFIGDFDPTIGFSAQMEDELEEKIEFCLEEECPDPGNKIKN